PEKLCCGARSVASGSGKHQAPHRRDGQPGRVPGRPRPHPEWASADEDPGRPPKPVRPAETAGSRRLNRGKWQGIGTEPGGFGHAPYRPVSIAVKELVQLLQTRRKTGTGTSKKLFGKQKDLPVSHGGHLVPTGAAGDFLDGHAGFEGATPRDADDVGGPAGDFASLDRGALTFQIGKDVFHLQDLKKVRNPAVLARDDDGIGPPFPDDPGLLGGRPLLTSCRNVGPDRVDAGVKQ